MAARRRGGCSPRAAGSEPGWVSLMRWAQGSWGAAFPHGVSSPRQRLRSGTTHTQDPVFCTCYLHAPSGVGALPWVSLLCSPCLGEGPTVRLTRPRASRLPQSSPLEPGISSSWLSSLRGPSQSQAHLSIPLSPAQLHATCACCAQTMCQDWVRMWGSSVSKTVLVSAPLGKEQGKKAVSFRQ